MIIPITDLVDRYGITLGTVLHLGAHLGKEAVEYQAAGAHDVVWVEADPLVAAQLSERVRPFGHRSLQALVSDRDGAEVDFYVSTNAGKSSSMLTMKTHLQEHPEITVAGAMVLRTTTVDTLCDDLGIDGVDLLTMDLQGAELLALRGASRTLRTVRYVYTEVNVDELYADCAQLDELDRALDGFERQETAITPHGWGDAFYIRDEHAPPDIEPRTWTA